ncbi:folic acid synthesis protein-like protein [Paraphoma chrysanthemicola]|uniref:Folic acid synthesis protein FOL1 n=1 Tax=Paraphoma chrysanthemicola TaxID=798071 RepID=A0A8K0QV49_9PLEO|nr:folic acid synthesis protein-like protein [Paraphoma chrysanthemicola]
MRLYATILPFPRAPAALDSSIKAVAYASGRICGDVSSRRSFSACRQTLPYAPFMSHCSKQVAHISNAAAPRFQKNNVRFSRCHDSLPHRAYVALGSNMGDRVAMVEQACKLMEATGEVKILRTSSLYETKAMYVLDQDNFVNGACEVATSLDPIKLLDFLQSIENGMGRVKVIDKGPRNIDLDILLYSKSNSDRMEFVNWHDDRLILPHALMYEREFALRPLHDILQGSDEALGHSSVLAYVEKRLAQLHSDQPLSPLTPLGRGMAHLTPHAFDRSTRIMSILNVTPDSFSDGGKNFGIAEEKLVGIISDHITSGATILDVGGQSTRPGSTQNDTKEELKRVLPAIRLIRSLNVKGIVVSVDTYRSNVAKAAVEAGADIINDVSAGLMDKDMLATAAKLDCTICLMHMRGTPETMTTLTSYPGGLIKTVGDELLQRVRAAEAAGVRRWRIILDPGIGFAKTQEQNLELLRYFDALRRHPGLEKFPWLVGTSRKGFIGHITGVDAAKDRVWGTAASVAAAVQGGADIVRVHDVQEMAQVAKMADAIWRASK